MSDSDVSTVLKLTLPGHYGIKSWNVVRACDSSEVDPTGSLWYKFDEDSEDVVYVLKLTLPGHYGIAAARTRRRWVPF